jgi:maltooligosyltrehalose trehalohydrolase
MNVDGPGADHVRRWIVESVVGFVRDHHIDGFRLDAVHGIIDQSAVHLLEELTTAAKAEVRAGQAVHVIAESDLCDPKLIRPLDEHGFGLDAQWADDFHHAVHVGLTGEDDGYYIDYAGLTDLAAMLRDRYVFAGRYSPYRDRTVGRPAPDVPYDRFVVCVQNHDQVGNRMLGERLSALVDADGQRFAAAMLLTSPFVPMLFMGEEYAEPAPFQYFVSHTDPDLAAAVTEGRRREFAGFSQFAGAVPDPQDPRTLTRSVLDRSVRDRGEHAALHRLYRDLLHLRHREPLITDPSAPDVEPTLVPGDQAIVLRRRAERSGLLTALHVGETTIDVPVADASGSWTPLLDTTAAAYSADTTAAAYSADTTAAAYAPDAPETTGPVHGGRAVHRRAEDGTLLLTLPPRAAVVLRQET